MRPGGLTLTCVRAEEVLRTLWTYLWHLEGHTGRRTPDTYKNLQVLANVLGHSETHQYINKF